jgi:hypothetical protein
MQVAVAVDIIHPEAEQLREREVLEEAVQAEGLVQLPEEPVLAAVVKQD